jgi:hypothetical protein
MIDNLKYSRHGKTWVYIESEILWLKQKRLTGV